MAHITLLDSNTINQIAAGEVIERPSSVVKELLENAIDAGATAVTVEARDGGISFLRITDNGCGIPKEEIPLAFLRHSTSKITRVEDLLTVSSLGFRGEALSSIASVAQVELITKTAEAVTGCRYVLEGGEEKSLEDVGAPDGTTLVVRNLFYNTPARRKFLKSPQTEGSYISSLVERLALSRPDISFRLLLNGQNRLHTAGNHQLRDILYTIYGRETAAELIPVEREAADGAVRVRGFLGKPLIARGNRSYENYFINGRYVKSNLITKAIENAYAGFVMQHKYPFVALHLAIEPSWLDVNVHPTKMELRFRNEETVYQAVYGAVRDALEGKELIPRVTLEEGRGETGTPQAETGGPGEGDGGRSREHGPEPFELRRAEAAQASQPYRLPEGPSGARSSRPGQVREQRAYEPSSIELFQQALRRPEASGEMPERPPLAEESELSSGPETSEPAGSRQTETAEADGKAAPFPAEPAVRPEAPRQLDLFEEKILDPKARDTYRLIGQLFDTYWLVQTRDQFLIIDQHAAHEKVLYERTMKSLAAREYTCQQMNPPLILTLNAREEQVLSEYREAFSKIGFEIEPFGGKEYAVYGVPGNLFGLAREDLLLELLDSLADEGGRRRLNLVEEKVALMSCKAAVKGNNRLSPAEAEALIDELMGLEHPYTCPHGRPTIVSMSQYELEKKFKRVVS